MASKTHKVSSEGRIISDAWKSTY